MSLVLEKIIRNKKVIMSGVIVLAIIVALLIYFEIWSNKEISEENIVEVNTNGNVDLSRVDSYIGDNITYEKTKELLNIICEEYNMYLSNATENGNSKGLSLYFSKDTEKNLETLKNNTIITMIRDYINTRENNSTGDFNIVSGIDDENRQYLYILKIDKNNLNGTIIDIRDTYIVVEETDSGNIYKVNSDILTSKFVNYRTNETIDISDIKSGDYYMSGYIIRNISGEEWKRECIENLAKCYVQGNLICNPKKIENIQDMGEYVIITLIMEDATIEYFNGKDNRDTFELKAIAYSDLEIPTYSQEVTIYNLKEETKGFMFWIGLDESTIDDKYPTINDIEIYDK